MYHAALTYLIFVAPCMKSMQACTKTHHFEIKNAKIFWGGDTPSPDPTPIFAPTVLKLNVTPPEKILVTALMLSIRI